MTDPVYVVESYINQIKVRERKAYESYVARQNKMWTRDPPHRTERVFSSWLDAAAFIIDRVEQELAKAHKAVEKSRAALRNCKKKYAAENDPTPTQDEFRLR